MQLYHKSKTGIFSIHVNSYGPNGWEHKLEERTIIGEDSDTFIERIQLFECGEWIGDNIIPMRELIAIGIHKSRLMKWLS